ncbi:MAG: hypothetical protein QM730_00755 [Anaerolineales bacterium]
MWTPEQKRNKEIPYRGGPSRKYPRRQRQVRNLKEEKKRKIWTILISLAILIAIFAFVLLNSTSSSDQKATQIIVFLVLLFVFIAPLLAGLSSINKFRKGYDVDVSEKENKKSGNE